MIIINKFRVLRDLNGEYCSCLGLFSLFALLFTAKSNYLNTKYAKLSQPPKLGLETSARIDMEDDECLVLSASENSDSNEEFIVDTEEDDDDAEEREKQQEEGVCGYDPCFLQPLDRKSKNVDALLRCENLFYRLYYSGFYNRIFVFLFFLLFLYGNSRAGFHIRVGGFVW